MALARRHLSLNRRARGRAGNGVPLAALCVAVTIPALLTGCFATSKQVEMIESDIARRGAWSDERLQGLERDIASVRSENEALRLRVNDLTDALAALGEEVSGRLQDLEESDRRVEAAVQQTARTAEKVGAEQEADREVLLERMNLVLDEVVKENKKLVARIDALESSAFTFGRMHMVKSGESLASIAKAYGVTAEAIAQANDLSDANLIQVGQQLLIPGVAR